VPEETHAHAVRPDGPLRVAVLVKQVPLAENLELAPDGRLRRDGVPLEMNPYCRRAVSKGTELASLSGGTCTVITLGPPSADDVLREALAWGADRGVHLCDPEFAGSDTLATARALAATIRLEGPFDLVLAGRSSTDGETGQVGPEVAELLDLPFAGGVRGLALDGGRLRLRLEQDDGSEEVETSLPAILTVAERLIEPAKADEDRRRAVPAGRISVLTGRDLGRGPWGSAGSPTEVGAVRLLPHEREGIVLGGEVASQVEEAVRVLRRRGALRPRQPAVAPTAGLPAGPAGATTGSDEASDASGGAGPVAVLLEPGRPAVGAELLGAARVLADALGSSVVAWRLATTPDAEPPGADEVVELVAASGSAPRGEELAAEDVATALTARSREDPPWAVLAPSTEWGREVAARTAAALGAGLVGDAMGLDVVDGDLVAAKPAFSGALVADITCTSRVRLVTVRPGVLPLRRTAPRAARRSRVAVAGRGRVRSLERRRDDDVEMLARAEVVIGVGTGVPPDEYARLRPLAALLGAELGATRKVTDKGWMPRSRQVGITGRHVAPRLYVAVGLSGKFNHVVGVRSAGTILAVNDDPAAPVFAHADVGIVGDWREVVPALEAALRDLDVPAVSGHRAPAAAAG
jgi:electron transfer flavoprotein alpha subunit